MFNLIKARINQGRQYIVDIREAKINKPFRGLPSISSESCKDDCAFCREICPTKAISINPVQIGLGKCIFCGDCEAGCPEKIISFSCFHKIASTSLDSMVVGEKTTAESYYKDAIKTRNATTVPKINLRVSSLMVHSSSILVSASAYEQS